MISPGGEADGQPLQNFSAPCAAPWPAEELDAPTHMAQDGWWQGELECCSPALAAQERWGCALRATLQQAKQGKYLSRGSGSGSRSARGAGRSQHSPSKLRLPAELGVWGREVPLGLATRSAVKRQEGRSRAVKGDRQEDCDESQLTGLAISCNEIVIIPAQLYSRSPLQRWEVQTPARPSRDLPLACFIPS